MFQSENNIYILVIVLITIVLRKLIPSVVTDIINTEFYDVFMTLLIVYIAKKNFIMSLIILNFYVFSTTLKAPKTSEFMTPQVEEEIKAEPFVINKEYFTQNNDNNLFQPKDLLNDYSTGYLNLESDLYK
jgi:hypothetical protein